MNRTTIGLPLELVLEDIRDERGRQDAKWGEQNHPDGTGPQFAAAADDERLRTETAAADGTLTFRNVLAEEVAEAYAESDPDRLRAELVQVAAVVACWIEAIDRREQARWSLTDVGIAASDWLEKLGGVTGSGKSVLANDLEETR